MLALRVAECRAPDSSTAGALNLQWEGRKKLCRPGNMEELPGARERLVMQSGGLYCMLILVRVWVLSRRMMCFDLSYTGGLGLGLKWGFGDPINVLGAHDYPEPCRGQAQGRTGAESGTGRNMGTGSPE